MNIDKTYCGKTIKDRRFEENKL